MNIVKNFLNSGYTFSEDEYELQSKYILLNSMLAVSIIMIAIIIGIQLSNGSIKLALLNTFQLIIGISGIFFLRKSKKIYNVVSYTIFSLVTATLIITILTHPYDYMRIGWFLILILVIFLLNGYQLGYPVTFLALVTAVSAYIMSRGQVPAKPYLLMIGFIILITILVQLYEYREKKIKYRLQQLNAFLEQRVIKETKKRVELYKKSNDRLEKLAHYDTLTKLPNRVLLFDRLNHAIKKAKRNKTKIAVLFLDLDNFKEINDSFDHTLGDSILEIFSQRLVKVLRQSDSVARFGGDEFVLLIEDVRETAAVIKVAQEIEQIFLQSIIVEDNEFFISASIGVSVYPDNGLNADILIKNADVAMYEAKNNGRSQVVFYNKKMTEWSKKKLMMDQQIRHGIKNDEFLIFYQPIINNHDNSLAGFEALVRWNHPQKGLISPDEFIPIAEMSSHVIGIGERVLQHVANQVILWHQQGFDPPFIAVNVSPKQLRSPELTALLKRTLDSVPFRRDWLEVEITEGYAIQNFEEAVSKLHEIKKLGITLSLDDFGTGYSSLSYLKKLPVDKIKIDRSFIHDIFVDKEDRILVKAIVSFSREMNLAVVAEGVEDSKQHALLKEIGCGLSQGYYFAKPLSPFLVEQKYIKPKG